MLTATSQWRQELADKKTQSTLRFMLGKTLFMELQERVHQLSQSSPSAQAFKIAQDRQLITSDGSWPFHRWDNAKKCLTQDPRTPLSMKEVKGLLDELVEAATNETWIMRFHAMKGGDLTQNQVVPWRLQVSMRLTEPW